MNAPTGGQLRCGRAIEKGDRVLMRAIVREAFADEAWVRIETGMRGLTQSVSVARDAVVRLQERPEEGIEP